MKAALLTALETIEITDIPKPTPGPEEVQVRVKCVAICGTDVHIYQGFPIGIFQPKLPLVLGHEFSATVSALGKNVTGFREGDRVTVEANIGCGKCYLCRTGAYVLCPEVRVLSIHANGGLAEYVVAPQTHVYHLPDSYDDEAASLTEPLAMAMCGYLRAPVMPGDFVAVLGAGTGGFCLAALAKMAGAEKVIMTDTREERLEVGLAVGADVVINARQEDVVKAVMRETKGHGADIVYEAAGVPQTFVQSVQVAAPRATISFYGVPVEPVNGFDFGMFLLKDLKMVSASGSPRCFSSAISAAASGRVNLRPLITHRLKLEDTAKAMSLVKNRQDGVVKALIKI
ncbi:MAG: alcohol dehydrogenase catalytic domain-containing protein [Actinobacteria bacterium]|nr:alcohol dehydrogenase catalytic domain-containing protein [Actinomycetota bacterium]